MGGCEHLCNSIKVKCQFAYLLCIVHVNSSNQKDDQDDWQNYCQGNVLTQDLMGWLE